MSMNDSSVIVISEVKKLVNKICGMDKDNEYQFQFVLRQLTTSPPVLLEEALLEQQISDNLSKHNSSSHAHKFRILKTQIIESKILRQPTNLIAFLHFMAAYMTPTPAFKLSKENAPHRPSIYSTPKVDDSGVGSSAWTRTRATLPSGSNIDPSTTNHQNTAYLGTLPTPFFLHPTSDVSARNNNAVAETPDPVSHQGNGIGSTSNLYQRPPVAASTAVKGQLVKNATETRKSSVVATEQLNNSHVGNENGLAADYHHHHYLHMVPTTHCHRNIQPEVPEAELIRSLLFVLLGINGELIHYIPEIERFSIVSSVGVTAADRRLVNRISECGWLYRKARHFVERGLQDVSLGWLGRALCDAISQYLTEYCRLVATLESQFKCEEDFHCNQCTTSHTSPAIAGLTLYRLHLWTREPRQRLSLLCCIADDVSQKKGGDLASELYAYLSHGDVISVRPIVTQLLATVCRPLHTLISQWIFEGQLEDKYNEFFVACNPAVKNDRLWYDKYALRVIMVPKFIREDQANKILLTGKCINFLRILCDEPAKLKDRENIQRTLLTSVDAMFRQTVNNQFERMINSTYSVTSKHLLEVLYSKYKFMDHVKAMRRYLLLGQGDFILHLMDSLHKVLLEPATSLLTHQLSAQLESSIRATNAQYDQADILRRLDVRMLQVSPNDTGWDVFSLDYKLDNSPLATIFTPDMRHMYLRIFNLLWRAKRMEFVLGNLWRNQQYYARMAAITSRDHKNASDESQVQARMKDISSLMHSCHLLTAEMLGFINQLQYYINFEVLESCWVKLLIRLEKAEDLDSVISAHGDFLGAVFSRCLLEESSTQLLLKLRSLFDVIITYEELMLQTVFPAAEQELDMCTRKPSGSEMNKHRSSSKNNVHTLLTRVQVNARSYQEMVLNFLEMLNKQDDSFLNFLSIRIDYNGHYRRLLRQKQSNTSASSTMLFTTNHSSRRRT